MPYYVCTNCSETIPVEHLVVCEDCKNPWHEWCFSGPRPRVCDDCSDERAEKHKARILKAAKKDLVKYSAAFVNEYINEAEHQDGIGYWYNFETVDEFLTDLQLYADNWSA